MKPWLDASPLVTAFLLTFALYVTVVPTTVSGTEGSSIQQNAEHGDGGFNAIVPSSPPILIQQDYEKTKTIYAWVTMYSAIESCHYAGCLDASGQRPTEGYSVACPRAYIFGTRIKINEFEFVCTDRTSRKYDGRFDIFAGYTEADWRAALAWGRQWKEITIYQ